MFDDSVEEYTIICKVSIEDNNKFNPPWPSFTIFSTFYRMIFFSFLLHIVFV
jgi:hypothetical protein